jgi:hypothetical protein
MASSLLRIIIRAILPVINKAHTVVLGIKPLERNSVICIEVKRHRGRPVKLEDGCRIGLGDPVIKLHFNDAWITNALQSTSASKGKGFPRGIFYNFRDGLHLLAAEAYAKRLGFQVIDLPNTLRIKLARLHISALMQSHQAPRSGKRISSRKPVKVKAVWLSLAELLRIYGSV